jgi:hypothetical protein
MRTQTETKLTGKCRLHHRWYLSNFQAPEMSFLFSRGTHSTEFGWLHGASLPARAEVLQRNRAACDRNELRSAQNNSPTRPKITKCGTGQGEEDDDIQAPTMGMLSGSVHASFRRLFEVWRVVCKAGVAEGERRVLIVTCSRHAIHEDRKRTSLQRSRHARELR